MLRSFALLAPAMMMMGSAAIAANYVATPVSAPAAGKTVARNMVWTCDGARCVAQQEGSTSRPAIICAVAVKELGPLSSFTVGDEAFDADALAKCNAKAG